MKALQRPIIRNEIAWISQDETILIFNPEKGDILKLNMTAARIWKLCDGKHTIEDIFNDILSSFKEMNAKKVQKDCWEFLKKIQKAQLITISDT